MVGEAVPECLSDSEGAVCGVRHVKMRSGCARKMSRESLCKRPVGLPGINQALSGTGGRSWPKGWWSLLRRRRILDQGRLLPLGVPPEYRRLGLYPLMLDELRRRSPTRYRRLECSWVLEDNANINAPVAAAGAVHDKAYRLYQKALA